MTTTITLAGVVYPVAPIPLGRLKTVLPAFGRVGADFASGNLVERTFDDLIVILAAALDTTPEVVGAITAPLNDLVPALETIAAISGLVNTGGVSGEAAPATGSTGTNSIAG